MFLTNSFPERDRLMCCGWIILVLSLWNPLIFECPYTNPWIWAPAICLDPHRKQWIRIPVLGHIPLYLWVFASSAKGFMACPCLLIPTASSFDRLSLRCILCFLFHTARESILPCIHAGLGRLIHSLHSSFVIFREYGVFVKWCSDFEILYFS